MPATDHIWDKTKTKTRGINDKVKKLRGAFDALKEVVDETSGFARLIPISCTLSPYVYHLPLM